MYSPPSHEAARTSQRCPSRCAVLAPPIDFYSGVGDDEMPLTGRALREVLEAGPDADPAICAEQWVPLGAISSHQAQAKRGSEDVTHYLCAVQTALATVRRDAGDVAMDEPLAMSSSDANARLAQSAIDHLVSGDPYHVVAPPKAFGTTARASILEDNPMLLDLLEAPTVTSSDYDACGPSVHTRVSSAFALPWYQPSLRSDALRYAVTADTMSVAPVSSSSVSPIDQPVTEVHTRTRAVTNSPSLKRVSDTTDILRLLAAVARRDIELPWLKPMDDEPVPRYDARFVLCAAYRAIILNASRNRGWLTVKRFTDALGLDATAFARWTSLYRQDDGPSNAFWDTLAPHAWADAFALIDCLETQPSAVVVPTLADLVGTRLHGRLYVGRLKHARAQLHGIGYAQPAASAAIGVATSGSAANTGTLNVTERGLTIDAPVLQWDDVDDMPRGRMAIPDLPSRAPPTQEPVAIVDALREVARSVRLVAAASCGEIVAHCTEALSHETQQRYDPRHLFIALHGALAENLRNGGHALSLRSFSHLVGLNPRTVYAWRYSHLRSGTPGAAFARSVVARSGTDHHAFVACLKTVMQERAPHETDLRGTPLHNRMLQRFESTLGLSSSDLQVDRARRVKAPPLPSVPDAMREMIGTLRHVVAIPFRAPAPAPAPAPATCAASDDPARRRAY